MDKNRNLLKGPNCFIIGAPKCGTSAMANALSQHPEIYLSEPKEPDFFVSQKYRFDQLYRIHENKPKAEKLKYKNLNMYLRHCFAKAEPAHKILIDASVTYLYSEVAIARILDYRKDAKFVIMLRNPIAAAISMYEHTFKWSEHNKEIAKNFAEAWHWLPERHQGSKLPIHGNYPHILYLYDELYCYHKHLSRFFSQVNKQQTHIILYDDFQQHSITEYIKLCSFLQISTDFRPSFNKVNSRALEPDTLYVKLLAYLNHKFPKVKFIKNMRINNLKELPKQDLTAEFLQIVTQFYREDILKTAKLINRDLSYWL